MQNIVKCFSTIKFMKFWKQLAIFYVLILLISTVFRFNKSESLSSVSKKYLALQTVDNTHVTDNTIQFAYKEFASKNQTNNSPILLIHGSPGDSEAFEQLAQFLNENHRVIAVDLPGFGDSAKQIPDYSFLAHAYYLREFLDKMNIEKVHIVGFSMGGGVVLSLEKIAPEKVASITMQSAIGVQEYELLGDYSLNHGIHGLQLAFFWGLENLTPHFGLFDYMAMPYCRNFYDSDQRPLREILQKTDKPFLIIHGKDDPLVPVEAAREHTRIVPQSEYHEIDDNHFFTFMRPEKASPILLDFFEKVEAGKAVNRRNADISRIKRSKMSFTFELSEAKGATAFVFFLLIVLSTMISEDLTCITAGVLAGQGRMSLTLAVFACIFGIYLGDILLFLSGRIFGRKALKYAPLKWFVSENSVERASIWFQKKGVWAVFLSRFIPGFRLPTYFFAGVARTNFWLFAVCFLIAVFIWTPVLVGLSYKLGAEFVQNSLMNSWWQIAIFIVALYLLVRSILQLSTWRGRRLSVGKIRRLRHWEFWSMQMFYPPILVYVAYLAIKFRGLNTFTCTNPAIYASGFVGESKKEIYQGLYKSEAAQPHLLKHLFLPKDAEKLESAKRFIAENNLTFPIALKPDVGERGADVFIVKSFHELEKRLSETTQASILQEFADGDEFGVFYYRYPNEAKGKIFAITEKQFPSVTGDGISSVETLILRDERAVCMAEKYFERNREKLDFVPKKGEYFRIVDIGTHSRGAIFLDGVWIKTVELEEKIDRICKGYKGFYFGRFDIRTSSIEDFKRGENFKLIELNGVTSEATSIYDRKNSLFSAYKTLFEQWRIAFEIGSQNRANGIEPTKIVDLLKLLQNRE
jgi:membrane protein DedA with SNARE-associated domain/pimeloyl-ACP methyl ester carboxylesterase